MSHQGVLRSEEALSAQVQRCRDRSPSKAFSREHVLLLIKTGRKRWFRLLASNLVSTPLIAVPAG